MPIGIIWYPPVDQQAYDAIREKVFDASLDKGLRFHAAGEAEGSWRIIETWDSREGLGRFIQEDLAPAVDEVSGGQAPTPGPELVFDIHFQNP
jgi:hypothetical protein